MSEPRSCGSCTLCCKLMLIEVLEKPIGQWCVHCDVGKGCKVYEVRPEPCRAFRCGWLKDPSLPDSLRPDRSKVILDQDADGRRFIARCDASNALAWKKEPLYSWLKALARVAWKNGDTVMASAYPRVWLIAPDEDIDLGPVPQGSGFDIRQGADGKVRVTILPPA